MRKCFLFKVWWGSHYVHVPTEHLKQWVLEENYAFNFIELLGNLYLNTHMWMER